MPLTCITRVVWYEARTLRGAEEDRFIQLTGMPKPLRLRRESGPRVYLGATQGFELLPDDRFARGEWKAHTTAYAYTLYDFDALLRRPRKRIAWHYHPNSGGSSDPHVHVYVDGTVGGVDLGKLHIPGDRVAFD